MMADQVTSLPLNEIFNMPEYVPVIPRTSKPKALPENIILWFFEIQRAHPVVMRKIRLWILLEINHQIELNERVNLENKTNI